MSCGQFYYGIGYQEQRLQEEAREEEEALKLELAKQDYYTYYGTNNLVSILFKVYAEKIKLEREDSISKYDNLFSEFRKLLSEFNYNLDNQIIKLDVKKPTEDWFYEVDKNKNKTGNKFRTIALKFELSNLLSNIEFEYEIDIKLFSINDEPHIRIMGFEVGTRTYPIGTDEEYSQNSEVTKINYYMKKMANIYNF